MDATAGERKLDSQSSAKGFTILSAASIINKLLGVLYVPILTLILGNLGNAFYNAGYTIYQLVFMITNAGIPVAISKLISEQRASERYDAAYRTLKISSAILISIGTVTSLLTAIFAKQLSTLVGWPESFLTILALSPTMLFTAVSCTFRGYFQGRSNMVATSISQIIEQAVNTTLTIVFAWLMYRYGKNVALTHGITDKDAINTEAVKYAAAGGTVGTSLGALASALYLCRTYFKNKAAILTELKLTVKGDRFDRFKYTSKNIIKKIFQYSIPITLGSVAIYTANLIDLSFTKSRLIASGFSVNEASELYGIFSTQYLKVLFIPVTIATALATTILPSISAAAARNDVILLRRRITKSIQTILMISVPGAVGMAVMAKPIVNILFPTAPDGWDLLMMGSWTLVLISVVSIQTAILQGMGKTYIPTVHLVIGLVLKLFTNYNLIAIKKINIKGALIGSAVCYIFACVMNYRSIRKYTGIRLNMRRLFNRPLSVSIIMGIVVLLIYSGLDLIFEMLVKSVFFRSIICGGISILIGVIVYYLLMIVAKGITADDIKGLPMGGRILAFTKKVPYMNRFLK